MEKETINFHKNGWLNTNPCREMGARRKFPHNVKGDKEWGLVEETENYLKTRANGKWFYTTNIV